MERHDELRYEFRVFGADLQPFARHLAGTADKLTTETSSETYVVSRLNIDANAKFRDADLDVKVLEAREGFFELWRPLLRADLPVASELFVEKVAPLLGIDLDQTGQAQLSALDIIEIVGKVPALKAVNVRKQRTKHRHSTGISEYTLLEIADLSIETVAVESSDLDAAGRLLETSGLSTWPNESYPAFLQGLLFQ